MAKISIDDRTERKGNGEEQILPASVRTKLYEACTTSLGRLGDAEKVVEVVKISPILVCGTDKTTTNFIEVKIVVVMLYTPKPAEKTLIVLSPAPKTSTRIENSFQFFFNEEKNVVEFFQKRFLEEFLRILVWKINEFKEFTSQLEMVQKELLRQQTIVLPL